MALKLITPSLLTPIHAWRSLKSPLLSLPPSMHALGQITSSLLTSIDACHVLEHNSLLTSIHASPGLDHPPLSFPPSNLHTTPSLRPPPPNILLHPDASELSYSLPGTKTLKLRYLIHATVHPNLYSGVQNCTLRNSFLYILFLEGVVHISFKLILTSKLLLSYVSHPLRKII